MAVSIKDYEFRGKTYDEWEIGEEFVTGGRTVTETDIVNFAGVTTDWSSTHTNDVYAKTTVYGNRIAYGNVTFIISTGLMMQTMMFEGTCLAMLDFGISYQEPVYFQDTIYVKFSVVEKRLSKSNPERGIIKIHAVVNNQNDEQVAEEDFHFLISTKKPVMK